MRAGARARGARARSTAIATARRHARACVCAWTRSGGKRRAPRSLREVRKFAEKMMKTKDVRLDVSLNKAIWKQGVRNVRSPREEARGMALLPWALRRDGGKENAGARPDLGTAALARGCAQVPRRIRVQISRKRNDEEDADEELYSLVTVVDIPKDGFKGLGTKRVDA